MMLLFQPVSGLFTAQPVIEQDWGLHAQHLEAMKNFWRQDGRLWGYSPYFMAGYPSNTIQDLSIKLYELLALPCIALGIDGTLAFRILVFLFQAAIPWMLFSAARNFFVDGPDAHLAGFIAALLGTAYWWNSLPREIFYYGMVGFSPASCLMILALSFLYRVLRTGGAADWSLWAWTISVALLIPLHIQAALLLIPLAAALTFILRGRVTARSLMWLTAGALVAAALNTPWLWPLYQHRGDDISKSLVDQLPLFLSRDFFAFLKDYFSPVGLWTFRTSFWEKGLRWMILAFAVAGIVRLMRSGKKDLAYFLVSGASGLFALAYFGSLIPWFQGWQPLRFKVPYDLFLILPATFLLSSCLSGLRPRRITPWARTLMAVGCLAFLVNVFQTEAGGRMRLRTMISENVRRILDWIRTETPQNARVLFEESGDETGFVYNGMYLSSFIPRMTGRELIGGPINLYNDRHHFAEMHSGQLFKRDITGISNDGLAAYFRTYNIGAVVAFHPGSIRRLLALPDLISVDRKIGPVHLMKVRQPLSWCLRGEAQVDAGWNRIHVSRARGEDLLLKYHWLDNLTADPPLQIEKETVLDDPIPFIRVRRPPAEFTLRVGR